MYSWLLYIMRFSSWCNLSLFYFTYYYHYLFVQCWILIIFFLLIVSYVCVFVCLSCLYGYVYISSMFTRVRAYIQMRTREACHFLCRSILLTPVGPPLCIMAIADEILLCGNGNRKPVLKIARLHGMLLFLRALNYPSR